MIAKRDIHTGELVLTETELYSQPQGYSKATLQRPEAKLLFSNIAKYAGNHDIVTGESEYLKGACDATNQLDEIEATLHMPKSPNIEEIWKLHDAHRTAKVGDHIMVDGLVSEAGRALNGKKGRVTSQDSERLGVEIALGGDGESCKRAIKRSNLKTLGGIFRTNAFEREQDGQNALYKILSRVNNACGNSANVTRDFQKDKVYVFATKEIRAGEEILIDYDPWSSDETGEERLALLRLKYNFECKCPEHTQSNST